MPEDFNNFPPFTLQAEQAVTTLSQCVSPPLDLAINGQKLILITSAVLTRKFISKNIKSCEAWFRLWNNIIF